MWLIVILHKHLHHPWELYKIIGTLIVDMLCSVYLVYAIGKKLNISLNCIHDYHRCLIYYVHVELFIYIYIYFLRCSQFLSLKIYSVQFHAGYENALILKYLVICLRGKHKKIWKCTKIKLITVIKFVNRKKYFMNSLGIIPYYNKVVYYR